MLQGLNKDTPMPATQKNVTQVTDKLSEMNYDELTQVRRFLDNRLAEMHPDHQGSADASADDEKKKYIAQHGANPNAQTTAQNVPQPSSDELKDLQNEKAREEHDARGTAANGEHAVSEDEKERQLKAA